MQRFIPSAKLYVGQLVVVTTHAEAQVRTIAQIHKRGTVYAVTFLWKEGDRVCGQTYEPWNLYKPTLDQIEYSITANGALISKNDVCKYVIKEIESARTTEEA